MDFEQWWEKNQVDVCSYLLIQDRARMIWQASRENQQEYQKYEFCRDVECEHLYNQKKCVVSQDIHCGYTAKEFHHWLKENGYKIAKER